MKLPTRLLYVMVTSTCAGYFFSQVDRNSPEWLIESCLMFLTAMGAIGVVTAFKKK